MDLFAKFESYNYLSETDQEIIAMIERDPISFADMSIQEISRRCYCSKSTIYRFCKKFDCIGLSELKIMVSSSISEYKNNNKNSTDLQLPFSKEDSVDFVVSNLKNVYEQSIYLAKSFININTIDVIASDLANAKKIILFVDDDQMQIAKTFKCRMEQCGSEVTVPENDLMKISVATSAKKDDIVIYASYYPIEKKHLEIIKELKSNKAKIITISSSEEHPLSFIGDLQLLISPVLRKKYYIADFSKNIIYQFVFDCLYSIYFKENYDRNLDTLKSSYLKYNSLF